MFLRCGVLHNFSWEEIFQEKGDNINIPYHAATVRRDARVGEWVRKYSMGSGTRSPGKNVFTITCLMQSEYCERNRVNRTCPCPLPYSPPFTRVLPLAMYPIPLSSSHIHPFPMFTLSHVTNFPCPHLPMSHVPIFPCPHLPMSHLPMILVTENDL